MKKLQFLFMKKYNKISLIIFLISLALILMPYFFINYYITHVHDVTTNEMIRTSIISYIIILIGVLGVLAGMIIFVFGLVKKK